jgi:putative phage-type endonuclease
MLQGSPEWEEWRLSGVGASEVAAILGVDPYGNTPYTVWKVKTRRSKGFAGNSLTEHGKEMEAKARARYELKNMDDMPAACATHPQFKNCIASLDGLRDDNKLILEIKCPKGMDTLNCAKAGRVPPHYWPQVQYQLAVTGAEMLHFFVYHEETKQEALVAVEPDVAYQGEIIAKVLDFWTKYVLTDTPPPLTDKDVKECDDVPEIALLCALIKAEHKTAPKPRVDAWKKDAVILAGHPKMSCNGVQVSTVLRNGRFSYHKLTIREGV